MKAQGPFSAVAPSWPLAAAVCAARPSALGGRPATSSGVVHMRRKALLASRTYARRHPVKDLHFA